MEPVFDETTKRLFRAILTLRTVEECERFFSDACTIQEIREISQRYEVAEMLKAGKIYAEIAQKTGASTATISRVNRCLQYGDGGYLLTIDRMEEQPADAADKNG